MSSAAQVARLLALAFGLVVVTAACGTRVKEAAPSIPASEVTSGFGATSGPDDAASPGATGSASLAVGASARAASPSGSTGGPVEQAVSGGGTGNEVKSAAPGVGSGTASVPRPSSPGSMPNGAGAGGARPADKPAGGTPAAVPSGSPVVIASVGTQSGLVGNAMVPFVNGIQLWVKDVNAQGGVNGHPVKFLVFDDGSDPGRHRALVREAVEVKHAVAFLGNAAPISGGAGVEYLTQKRIPVILVCGCEPWAYATPMMFPATVNGDAALRVFLESVATRMIPAGKTKLGILTCAEAQVCRDADRVFAANAKPFGYELAYRGQFSITQPDFTAECLAMRNAGVQVAQITASPAIFRNIVASCARQGYRPTYGLMLSMVDAEQKDNPDLAGAVASSVAFPYFQSGTPATDEFVKALAAYGSGLTPGLGLAQGWTGAKLFEKATTRLPEPPTSAAILDGLWSIKHDDLGGLTGPLTFTADQPAPPVACWFNLELKDGWRTPDNFARHCE